jgi:hypothetical protein
MAVESPLIQQARVNLEGQVALRTQRQQADEFCADTRLICEELLEQRGKIARNYTVRAAYGPLLVVTLGLAAIPFEIAERSSHGCHFWEIGDRKFWNTSINNGEEVRLVMASTTPVPAKADYIKVMVDGLDSYLSLSKNQGQLVDRSGSSRDTFLKEAREWNNLISQLRNPQ